MKILISLFCIYLFLCILLYTFQDRIIFFPEKLSDDHVFHFPNDFEEKYFSINETTRIHALHFFAKKRKGTILYFHGNAGSLAGWGDVAQEFVELGYDVLIPDYRGYGKSNGKITEQAFYDDAQMMYDFLLEKNHPSEIIIYGRSIGTGVAVDLGSRVEAQQLILETPFANFSQMAQDKFKLFPVKLLLKFQFRNDLKIKNINFPIHILHGTKDKVVPYEQSQQLIHILGNESILTTIPKGGHNNLGEFSLYWKKIKELLP